MPLIYAGIDEAGYGPLLGPLCVGLSVFKINDWSPAPPPSEPAAADSADRQSEIPNPKSSAPDLWKLLDSGVCRKPNDRRRRIAVDDSKALKLPNDSPNNHPLTHLERGILSFLGLASDSTSPEHDAALFAALAAEIPAEPWYAHPTPLPCPATTTPDAISISTNMLRAAAQQAGVSVLAMRCRVMGETDYNELVQAGGSKAAATEAALIDHLWMVWENWGHIGSEQEGGGVRVVCDRQGGREQYGDLLQRAFPGVKVVETHRNSQQSRYELKGVGADGGTRDMHVLFLVESERHHLPVALASMIAKHTRESFMARFNRFWCARMPELKPTAGYRGDAWRWLEDARAIIADSERQVLIRRA